MPDTGTKKPGQELVLQINAGEKTCARSYGKFCNWYGTKNFGQSPCCMLFNAELHDEKGGIEGWLQRLPECLEADASNSKNNGNAYGVKVGQLWVDLNPKAYCPGKSGKCRDMKKRIGQVIETRNHMARLRWNTGTRTWVPMERLTPKPKKGYGYRLKKDVP